MKPTFSVVDLFAGAGGFSLAAHELGAKILAAIEFDKDACDTYKTNIIKRLGQKTKLYEQDILNLTPIQLMSDIALPPRSLDLLIGGPPCQGFSSHRINNTGIDDPRNKLLIRYFDFVHEIQPKVFLVENVPGLLWKRHEKYLNEFMMLGRENGYFIKDPVIINAKDYGIPQNRNRVFILGIRMDVNYQKIQWPPAQTHFDPKEKKQSWKTASTVFEMPPQNILNELKDKLKKNNKEADIIMSSLQYGLPLLNRQVDPCTIHMQHSQSMIERLADTPINGSRDDISFRLPCHEGGYAGHKDVYGRIRLHLPGPTMTTGCFNPSKGRFVHPWENHGITPRHAARFQTFPDNYVFKAGITSQGKQIGNAVPVKLGEVLINHIAKYAIE